LEQVFIKSYESHLSALEQTKENLKQRYDEAKCLSETINQLNSHIEQKEKTIIEIAIKQSKNTLNQLILKINLKQKEAESNEKVLLEQESRLKNILENIKSKKCEYDHLVNDKNCLENNISDLKNKLQTLEIDYKNKNNEIKITEIYQLNNQKLQEKIKELEEENKKDKIQQESLKRDYALLSNTNDFLQKMNHDQNILLQKLSEKKEVPIQNNLYIHIKDFNEFGNFNQKLLLKKVDSNSSGDNHSMGLNEHEHSNPTSNEHLKAIEFIIE
jgi:DNA repair exonuclease SbcCD ATPase subunit